MMKSLEHLLSPVILNRDSNLNENSHIKELALMEKISQEKLDIIHKGISLSQIELLRPEINESWLRSHRYGLQLNNFNYGPIIDKNTFAELIQEKELLLQAADPYIRQLESMFSNTESMILLSDERGVMLRVLVWNHTMLNKIRTRFSLTQGVIWNEETVGTCAHGITLLKGIPMQISGPEHYCETFGQFTCSSAPIYDVNRNLAGTLCLVSSRSLLQNYHSLGLVISMASAIQSELQLIMNSELLNISLETTDEAIIVTNKSGKVTQANLTAKKVFSYLNQDIIGMQVEFVLGNLPLLKSVLETGKTVFDVELEIEPWNKKMRLLSAQSVNGYHGKPFGCILRLKNIDLMRKPSSQVISAEAGFTFSQIIGDSPQLFSSINKANKFARLDANILIQGESGTGKEMFAQSIHHESRPDGPFVAVNCAAIPQTLIESELFGYEGGAFTGAERKGKQGKIELAHGGTLFLDEIGDMPMELQAVLLRVIEEKKVIRVGGRHYIPVNFRLIAATNKDLVDLVKNKLFREDLYFRLAIFTISIPPLRERGVDIINLVKHYINTVANLQKISAPSLSNPAKYMLLHYNWPGNVRQLKNAILYAVNMSDGRVIQPEDLPDLIRSSITIPDSPKNSTTIPDFMKSTGVTPNSNEETVEPNLMCNKMNDPKQSINEVEKGAIAQVLLNVDNNISEAAKVLGISRSTLYRKIRKYNL